MRSRLLAIRTQDIDPLMTRRRRSLALLMLILICISLLLALLLFIAGAFPGPIISLVFGAKPRFQLLVPSLLHPLAGRLLPVEVPDVT